jgi:hypothetical protein
MFHQAIAAALLGAYVGELDVGLMTAVNNRTTAVAETIGWLSNSVILRLTGDRNTTWHELFQLARNGTVGILRNGLYPYHLLESELNPHAVAPATGPWCRISFQPRGSEKPISETVEVSNFEVSPASCFPGMLLDVGVRAGLEHVGLFHAKEWLPSEGATRFLTDYARTIEWVVSHPDAAVSDLEARL